MPTKARFSGWNLKSTGSNGAMHPLYDFFILEYNVKNVGSDTLEDVFMAFRYDVDVSSNETGTASYSADDFVALDQTPDALNPRRSPESLSVLRILQRLRTRIHRFTGIRRVYKVIIQRIPRQRFLLSRTNGLQYPQIHQPTREIYALI